MRCSVLSSSTRPQTPRLANNVEMIEAHQLVTPFSQAANNVIRCAPRTCDTICKALCMMSWNTSPMLPQRQARGTLHAIITSIFRTPNHQTRLHQRGAVRLEGASGSPPWTSSTWMSTGSSSSNSSHSSSSLSSSASSPSNRDLALRLLSVGNTDRILCSVSGPLFLPLRESSSSMLKKCNAGGL